MRYYDISTPFEGTTIIIAGGSPKEHAILIFLEYHYCKSWLRVHAEALPSLVEMSCKCLQVNMCATLLHTTFYAKHYLQSPKILIFYVKKPHYVAMKKIL